MTVGKLLKKLKVWLASLFKKLGKREMPYIDTFEVERYYFTNQNIQKTESEQNCYDD